MFEEKKHLYASKAAVSVLLLTLVGCASAPNPRLTEAHQVYQQVASNPDVMANAPQELDAAKQTLAKADKAWDEGEKQKTEHLSYMATQQANIAQTLAQAKQYEQQIDQLGRQRDDLLKNMSMQQAQVSQQQVLQLQQQLKDLQTKQTDRGITITLSGVLFQTGSANIKPGARHQLDQVARVLLANPKRKALIEGHTDNVGSSESNFALSEARANSVRDYLVAAGVPPQQLETHGYGETRPVAPNTTAAGRQQNRRVEITILNEGQQFPSQ
jgi:outer membrane protein OmpA-like peptidoglycan-associated protein